MGFLTEENVEAMDLDVGFRVDGVGEAGKLRDSTQVREEVLRNLASTRSAVDIFRVLHTPSGEST